MALFGIHLSEALGNAIAAAVCALMAASAIVSGASGAGAFIRVRRSEEPRAFWLFMVGWGLLALLFGYWAVVNALKGA